MTETTRIAPFGVERTLLLAANRCEHAVSIELWRDFQPEVALPLLGLRRLKVMVQAMRPFPQTRELYFSSCNSRRWVVYFCYAPDGTPRPSHRFTIERLRAEGFAILCVCATPNPEQARPFLDLGVQGVIWKAMNGYDFSGYTAGLNAIAKRFERFDVLVLNDSVFGPFYPLRPCLDSSPWDVTGFMTSYAVEHHIISFAFYLKGYDHNFAKRSRKVFFRNISFNSQGPVSLLQETRLGSSLAKSLTVGSILAPSPKFKTNYYLLANAAGLVDAGFPFLKESIFTKFSKNFDQSFYCECLENLGHPNTERIASE